MIHPITESDKITSSPQSDLSSLYVACRQNDIDTVTNILSDISVEKLNQKEPNGSTALHVAAYYGHNAIVRLLLDKGAVSTIKNKYGLTAAEEARTDETRLLFEKRVSHDDQNRFVGHADSIEWLTVNERAAEYAAFYQAALKEAYDEGLDHDLLLYYLSQIYKENPAGIDLVLYLIELFFKTNDPKLIVMAYTVESAFYRSLNSDLATMIRHQDQYGTKARLTVRPPGAIAAVICCSPTLQELSFVGETFRGMLITRNDLNQYTPGSIIMVKSFLSTSKNRSVAETFSKTASQQGVGGESLQFPVICHYSIHYPCSALAIENISLYKTEQEVLILPLTVFKVKSVKDKNSQFEIKLVEQPRLSIMNSPKNLSGICCIMCYYAWPSCYRLCCLKYRGAVEYPDS